MKLMVPSHSPEVITISDCDEETSQELNSTTEEEECPNDHFNSRDIFSSESDLDICDNKAASATDFTTEPRVLSESRNRRIDCYAETQCSSSIVSPQMNYTLSTAKNRGDPHYVHTNGSLILSCFPECDGRKTQHNESNKDVVKYDPWTNERMSQIAKKLEDRRKVMTELVQSDERYLNKMQRNANIASKEKNSTTSVSGAVIRKKVDRARLQGVSCAGSKAYFDALELSPESKERRINEISRVRVVAQRMPSTPENYWEVGFPSESEQRRRGLITEVRVVNKKGRKLFK